ncbi:MAG: L,D-transpeptidase family protein [Chitinophagales bacterium]
MPITFRHKYYKYALIALPYVLLLALGITYKIQSWKIKNSSFIIIDKNTMKLSQYNFKGELLQQSAVATGKNYGNKSKRGDMKTPEGIFHISEVVNAGDWKHDFKDDSLGAIAGAYGPYFIRLEVPGQKGIGIHGTHDNNSLNTRASEGCIRLKNEDLEQLVKRIGTSSIVIITPGILDVVANRDTIQVNQTKSENKKPEKKDIEKPIKQIVEREKPSNPSSINNLTPKKQSIQKSKAKK